MKRFLLDSGIANLYMRKHPLVLARYDAEVLRGNRVGVSTPILGELRSGIERSKSRDRNLKDLNEALIAWFVWPFDMFAASEYGLIDAYLEQVGRKIQEIDIQHAAIAKTLRNCTVVTMDGDFQHIPGLTVENWAVP